jgi:cell division protein FtsZ
MPDLSGVAKIKVIGVGGGGGNAVNRMKFAKIDAATFIAANTDMQALNMSQADIKIQLGAECTKGLGAGSDPERGRKAAEESRDEIRQILSDCDLLFITAGMGGGTGTGAAPVIAQMAQEMGILTIAVVTKPFERFEGQKRMDNATAGIEKLRGYVDTLLIVPNERISTFVPKGTSIITAFQIADDVLKQGIQGITDIITTPSLINLDFADIQTILKYKGNAHIGIGVGKGDNRALDAVRQAVQSPLLETNIWGAKGMVIYVSGDKTLTIDEVYDAVGLVREVVHQDCNVIFGMGLDETLQNEVKVTIIATGFESEENKQRSQTAKNRFLSPAEKAASEERTRAQYGYETKPNYKAYQSVAAAQINDEITPSRTKTNSSIPPFLVRMQQNKK